MDETKRLPICRQIAPDCKERHATHTLPDTLFEYGTFQKSSLHRQICMVQAAFIC
jgi:hypothetical protein